MDAEHTHGENKMTNEITNTDKWTTKKGMQFEVVSTLTLSETINADGHKTDVDCCKTFFTANINGKRHPTDGIITTGYPQTIRGHVFLAKFGRLYMTDQNDVDRIQAVVAKTESHPAWLANQALVAKNQKEIAEMDAQQTANGYCYKCESYCYGDCAE